MTESVETTIVVVGHVDHGKSTLIGRLLYDTGQVDADRVEFARQRSGQAGRELEFAFLLDGLSEEQEQGVTIDFTRVRFHVADRPFVLVDAPGHRRFLQSMLSGASRADSALLVVDASEGPREQTRLHAVILGLLGISRATVVVNKMDRADWSEPLFRRLALEGREILEGTGVEVLSSVPAAALLGENLAGRSERMPWYQGPTVLEAILAHEPSGSAGDDRFRMPVQDVYREGDRRLVVGRIDSGTVATGDPVILWPSGERSTVRSFAVWPGPPRDAAGTGESVALELSEPLFAERGMALTAPAVSLVPSRAIDVRIVWLGQAPLRPGDRLPLRLGHQETGATVARFRRIVDPGEIRELSEIDALPPGFVGEASLFLDRPILTEPFRICPTLGRFVLVDSRRVAGGGIVSGVNAALPGVRKPPHRRREPGGPSCVWLTGLPGAGKTTIARRVEARLLAEGVAAYVLDGDELRTGLCRDLGFSRRDRAENVRRVAETARILADAGVVVIVALISPYRDDRGKARALFDPGDFAEVFVRCPVEICEQRDPKGNYRKARAGELPRFTGVSDDYEEPESPELIVDTNANDEETAAGILHDLIAGHAAVSVPPPASD